MLGIDKLTIMAELSKMEVDCMGMGREENSKGWPSLVPRPFFYEWPGYKAKGGDDMVIWGQREGPTRWGQG